MFSSHYWPPWALMKVKRKLSKSQTSFKNNLKYLDLKYLISPSPQKKTPTKQKISTKKGYKLILVAFTTNTAFTE